MSFFNADIRVTGGDGLLLKDLGTDAATPNEGFATLYVNGGNMFMKKHDDSITNMSSSGGGGGVTLTGNTATTICTVSGDDAINGEDNLTFDGSTLNVNSNITCNTSLSIGNNSLINTTSTGWTQIGSTIYGEASNDNSGRIVSANQDCTIIATGTHSNDDNGTDAGQVRVYAWRKYTQDDEDNSTYHYTSTEQGTTNNKPLIVTANTSTAPIVGEYYWTQLGTDFDGVSAGDNVMGSALNADGTIIVIGAAKDDDGASNGGVVKVYKWGGSTWSQIGSNINGDSVDQQLGKHVRISNDGTIVACGGSTQTKVLEWDGSSWNQLGSTLTDGGNTCNLSGDGKTLSLSYFGAGYVRVYKYNGSSWIQLGSEVNPSDTGNRFGYSHALSKDGKIFVAGDSLYSSVTGIAKVFSYANGSWTQRGYDIIGEASNDDSGYWIDINGDGTIVMIGAAGNVGNAGHVRAYRWRQYTQLDEANSTYHYTSREQGTTNFKPLIVTQNTSTAPVVGEYYWTQIGYDINGDGKFGHGIKLSLDGSRAVIGAIEGDGVGLSNNGSTRIYNFKEIDTLSISNKKSYVSITEDGNVGIGTTMPENKLEVWGSTKLYGSVTTGHINADEGLTVTNDLNIGGFLITRLDLICGAYIPANASDVVTPRTDEYYAFVQSLGALEGVVMIPFAAEETPTAGDSSYAIQKPWGNTSATYQQVFSINSGAIFNLQTPSSTGYNFYHINGTRDANGQLNFNLPAPVSGRILVIVLRVNISASGSNNNSLQFNSYSQDNAGGSRLEYDNNSLAILTNAPEISRVRNTYPPTPVTGRLRIIKDYSSNSQVRTTSRVSAYIYCRPNTETNNNYQMLAVGFASNPGDSTAAQSNTCRFEFE